MDRTTNTGFTTSERSIWITFGVLFFVWGFLTVLNFILIDHLAYIFKLSYSLSTLINLTFFTTYLVVSLQAGNLIKKIGYKKGIIVGWILSCIGCFAFFLSVYNRSFETFLVALFILAAGITILQVGANLYIVLWRTIVGKKNIKTAGSALVSLQAFNSLGTFLAPFLAPLIIWLMVSLPFDARANLDPKDIFFIEVPYFHFPYLFLGIIMIFYLVYLLIARIPHIETSNLEPLNKMRPMRRRHVMHFPQLRLGAFAIFAYVGAEVALGNYLVSFAPSNVVYYWGGAMVGRFIGAYLLLNFSIRKAVGFCAGVAGCLVMLSMITPGEVSFWAITAVGLFNSILFPSIFTLGVNGLGKFSEDGSSVLIMSIVGGAVIPFNVINFSYVSYKIAFFIVIVCYIYILIYGLKLSRFEKRQDAEDVGEEM